MFRTQEAGDGRRDWRRRGDDLAVSERVRQTTLGKLRQGTKLSDQLLVMGVGWLAREGKVSIIQQGRTVKVSLREG